MSYLYDDEEESKDPRRIEERRAKWKSRAIEERDESGTVPSKYGICAKCQYIHYKASLYGKEWAYCEVSETRPLKGDDPITTCTSLKPAGQISLANMWSIATFIDPDKKDPIGFGSVDDKG